MVRKTQRRAFSIRPWDSGLPHRSPNGAGIPGRGEVLLVGSWYPPPPLHHCSPLLGPLKLLSPGPHCPHLPCLPTSPTESREKPRPLSCSQAPAYKTSGKVSHQPSWPACSPLMVQEPGFAGQGDCSIQAPHCVRYWNRENIARRTWNCV